MLSAACLLGCSEPQVSLAYAASGSSPSGTGLSGRTAVAARKQNWNCGRIERAIANLVAPIQAAKARAEKEEEQMPQTLGRMVERLSGAPGAGNIALAEYRELRIDADQLNDLLKEKGCPTLSISVGAPSFLK